MPTCLRWQYSKCRREWETVKIIDKCIPHRGAVPAHFICIHSDYNSEFYILHTLDLALVVALYSAAHTAQTGCLVLHRLP